MEQSLKTWKTNDIFRFHQIYSVQIRDMDRIRQSLGLEIKDMEMRIDYPDLKNIFIARFNRDMKKAISYVEVLEAEMNRRKKLIGVFG